MSEFTEDQVAKFAELTEDKIFDLLLQSWENWARDEYLSLESK